MRKGPVLLALAGLALLAYLPALTQPFIADDFVNLWKARQYAPISGWKALSADPIHFFRPVLVFSAWAIDRLFGPWPPAFYGFSLLLHVLVTWLIFALGRWDALGWRISALAAAFFAVHEGHQEAVMWFSAVYEPFLALFLLLGLLAWIEWLRSPQPRPTLQTAALFCFLLALASKESAVMMIPLLALPLWIEPRWRWRGVRGLPPFLIVALAWYGWMFFGGTPYPRLGDGSFSFHAPFLKTWLNSFARLLWPFGFLAVTVLLPPVKRHLRLLLLAGLWISIALIPYCFLTYLDRIPSRQTYVAGIGLAWLTGAAFLSLWDRYVSGRKLIAAAGVIVVAANVGYLWTRKRTQFLERAAPTEALIRLARHSEGRIRVEEFPYPLPVAQGAVLLGAGRPPETIVWAVQAAPIRAFGYRFSIIPEQASADPPRAMH